MRALAIATLSIAVLASTSSAAGPPEYFPRLRSLFDRKKKDDEAPAKVKQLLETLKSDTDEKKRKAAAEGLGEHDPRGNPEIMSGLITSLRQDPAVAVRTAAAEMIGKLKPVAAQAGVALEDAVQADPSDGVRKAAQAALFQYHLNGYKGASTATVQSAEPPLAGIRPKPAVGTPTVRPNPSGSLPIAIGRGQAGYVQSPEPPLAKPKAPPTPPAPSIAPPTSSEPTVVPPATVSLPGVPSVIPPPIPMPMTGIPGIPTPGKPNG